MYSIDYKAKGVSGGGNDVHPPIPNGAIISSFRLACTLHYVGGGSPYDIAPLFGTTYQDVISGVWIIIHAINLCPEFKFHILNHLRPNEK